MYTLNPAEISKFNLANAARFVDFWSKFYNYRVATVLGSNDRIDYFAELNIGNNLTEENVRRLLRWKDPHRLTHLIRSGRNDGQDNPRVTKVLNNLEAINRFRTDQNTEDEMRDVASQVFPNGIVFRVFLLHMAKPYAYPIADQHVFRACSLHTGLHDEKDWTTYTTYRTYFFQIAEAMNIAATAENIRKLKSIDAALLVFGQFLKTYGKKGRRRSEEQIGTEY